MGHSCCDSFIDLSPRPRRDNFTLSYWSDPGKPPIQSLDFCYIICLQIKRVGGKREKRTKLNANPRRRFYFALFNVFKFLSTLYADVRNVKTYNTRQFNTEMVF